MAKRFVCAADEIWRLQRGADADCLMFQSIVTGGERIRDRGTRQGTWVIAPGGALLAFTNSRDPQRVLAALQLGLDAWEQLSDAQRHLPADVDLTPAHRWEQSLPEGGLVLERIARVLPEEGLAGARSDRWNRDFVWFSADELAREFPDQLPVGETFSLPLVASRLARLHLVDNARGQTIPYAPQELELARLDATVVSREGDHVQLEFDGHTLAVSDGSWHLGENDWKPSQPLPHGIETRLVGRAVWDTRAARLLELELIGLGRHWGRTENNGRGLDPSPGLVGFLMRPAAADQAVAPTFILAYDADWVRRPEVPTWRVSPDEVSADRASD